MLLEAGPAPSLPSDCSSSGNDHVIRSRMAQVRSWLPLADQRETPKREQSSNDKADPRNSHGQKMGSNLHRPLLINPPAVQDRHKREENCRHYDVRHLILPITELPCAILPNNWRTP